MQQPNERFHAMDGLCHLREDLVPCTDRTAPRFNLCWMLHMHHQYHPAPPANLKEGGKPQRAR